VPIVAVTGTNGKTTTSRMIAHILKMAGRRVGLTTTDGIYIDGTQIASGDMSGPGSARMVLQNPAIDTAVLETARGGIVRSGLGFDHSDVAVVTNVTGDHLGLHGVNTMEDLARVKGVVAASTGRRGTTVLNADDAWCVKMSAKARGRVIYFSLTPDNPVVARHLKNRGVALILRPSPRGDVLSLVDRRETSILHAKDIPATFEGRARVNIANALAAAATCIGLEVDLECIRQGLRSFSASFYQTPGRLNFVDTGRGRALIDYCHNVGGMEALADFIAQLAPGRTLGVIAMPGDRRDEDIRAFAQVAARTFDEVIVREDAHTRGRARGEVASLMRDALVESGLAPERVAIETDELAAIRATLDRLEPDQLAVLLVDRPGLAWAEISGRLEPQAAD
jgi:cyanophycin synthetase